MLEKVTPKDLAHAVAQAKGDLTTLITSGEIKPTEAAIYRKRYEILDDQWTNRRKAVLRWYSGVVLSKQDRIQQWLDAALKEARAEVAYETVPGNESRLVQKRQEYHAYAAQVRANFAAEFAKVDKVRDNKEGLETTYSANPEGPKLVEVMLGAFFEWFEQHHVDETFLTKRPRDGMNEFLLARKDMIVLYKLIFSLPKVKTVNVVEIERPLMVEAVELAVGFIPVVGNGIALYEAASGRDLFGYRLSNLERGILAATVLLPVAGRLVKGGRAMYTNARLAKLYGKEAAAWERTIQRSAKAMEERAALQTIKNADEAIRVTGKLEAKLAKEAAEALPKVVRPAGRVILEAEKEIKVLFEALSKKFPVLKELDEFAIRRVAEKGSNIDHIKGQLLEELMESYIVPMLRNRQAGFALGLKVPKGVALEFIPGHLVRTWEGKIGHQITDGIVGYYKEGVFHIAGIFEAKAGRKGARELSLAKKKLGDLSQVERDEFRAAAKDVMREQKDIADAAGQAYTKTIEDVEKEFIHDELGGQVRLDFERLGELEDGTLMNLRIGGNLTAVKMLGELNTKIFAIVPKGVTTTLIETEVKAIGCVCEALAVPIHRKDLARIAQELSDLAKRML